MRRAGNNPGNKMKNRIQSNHKAIYGVACGMIWLWVLLFFPESAFSQVERAPSRALQVGVIVAPPAYIKTADNQWEGFSVELWQAVAQRMGVQFEFREFSSLEHMLDALEKREIDVIPSLPVPGKF